MFWTLTCTNTARYIHHYYKKKLLFKNYFFWGGDITKKSILASWRVVKGGGEGGKYHENTNFSILERCQKCKSVQKLLSILTKKGKTFPNTAGYNEENS